MGIVVYSANIGGYDRVAPISSADTRNLLFTTEPEVPEGWERVDVEDPGDIDARIRLARNLKSCPHRALPCHVMSIWIDGNMRWTASPASMTIHLDAQEIATFRYPATYGPRDCLYDEAAACIRRRKDDPAIIRAQMRRYESNGYPAHNGLVETSLVARLNSARVSAFNELWWEEIRSGSRRDQLSFNYVAWKSAMAYAVLPGSRIANPFAEWRPHLRDIYVAS